MRRKCKLLDTCITKKPPHSQLIQRRVMALNSFFAEKFLSHGVASVVGYYRQVLLLCMLNCFSLSIYMHCVGRCLSQVFINQW